VDDNVNRHESVSIAVPGPPGQGD